METGRIEAIVLVHHNAVFSYCSTRGPMREIYARALALAPQLSQHSQPWLCPEGHPAGHPEGHLDGYSVWSN